MSQSPSICTIIAKNYIASARTLCRSFLANHPDGKCFVLIIDDFEGFINPDDECFEILQLPCLNIPDLPNFCFKYDLVELSTAVKPYFLDYLIRGRLIDKILYLDPDILVTNPLTHLFDTLDNRDIVMTPHTVVDFPEDGFEPDVRSLLVTGVFNLGFIGVNSSKNATAFLDWWKGKVYNDCVVDSANGFFVDQRFCDLVPSFFDNYFIEKDAGYNAANWNLHARRIDKENGRWKCNEGSLYFFHFSNYKLETPDTLSKWSTRYDLRNRPDLRSLFELYRGELLANGYYPSRSWPYSHDFFRSGEPIPKQLRSIYRESQGKWKEYGDPFNSPELIRMAASIRRKIRAKKTIRSWIPNKLRQALRKSWQLSTMPVF